MKTMIKLIINDFPFTALNDNIFRFTITTIAAIINNYMMPFAHRI